MNSTRFATLLAFAMATPAASWAQAAPTTPTAANCELGENIGVDIADATVASRIVCAELMQSARKHQVQASYRVNFGKLGERILMQVNELDAAGAVRDERHLQLLAIENVAAISPRIAESLVSKRAMGDLETTENVLPEEEMQRRQKQGRMHFEAGLIGTSLVGSSDAAPAPGIHLGLSYELKRGYLSGSLRGAGAGQSSMSEIGIGGGTYLSDADIAPYVGGGVSFMALLLDVDSGSESGAHRGGTGFAPYAEAGVGIFRTSKTGLRAGVRASAPTFKAASTNGENKYVVPVSLSLAISF